MNPIFCEVIHLLIRISKMSKNIFKGVECVNNGHQVNEGKYKRKKSFCK